MYKNDRITRRYSELFKLKILAELNTGKYTKSQLGKLYNIAPTTINEWIRKDVDVNKPNQVWVSDITYIRTVKVFCYLALITDMYSCKIIGYDLSDSLELKGCVRALNIAVYQTKILKDLFIILIEEYTIVVIFTHKYSKEKRLVLV